MTIYYQDESVTLHVGDCLDVLSEMSDASVDAVVTDPPYGLGFMGKEWDALPPGLPWAQECLRVLKPGGHLLAFGGSRTWHRLACAVEDAGFEIRDSIAWLYGSGFPKSLDVSKAIDKARNDRPDVLRVTRWLEAQRNRAGLTNRQLDEAFGFSGMAGHWTSVASQPAMPKWDQWLKLRDLLGFGDEMDAEVWRLNGRKGTPGEAWQTAEVLRTENRMNEPSGVVNVGQGERTAVTRQIKAANTDAAQQWQGWGTALKPAHEPVVVGRKPLAGTVAQTVLEHGTGALNIDGCRVGDDTSRGDRYNGRAPGGSHSMQIAGSRDETWTVPPGRWPANVVLDETQAAELDKQPMGYGGEGGASRFFPTFRYEAKAPGSERPRDEDNGAHPTVKPLDLMRWLVRLVTPPGGTVLDPFLGSGTTAEACVIEGFRCIGIERDPGYAALAVLRLSKPIQPDMFGGAK